MSNIAIKAEGLGKQYRIGEQTEKYRTLRDTITGAFRPKKAPTSTSTFWALRDASFAIEPGEVVGVIGRNGAGKSTLLKVLSRITEPTAGYAEIHGRVRSLLEVGTGFHQELTGRENIQLNGAILGMKRAEIERKFDEIVAFAEVEKFIDTPVKRYSSGMYLRLAFAVAAHLEPEILLIDEVMAVGDAAFQKKCLGKMGEVAEQGRTVLFVSHNMSAVKELCHTGILLEAGTIARRGSAVECIAEYLRGLETQPAELELGRKGFALGAMQINDGPGNEVTAGEPFKVTLTLAGANVVNPMMFFIIEDFAGNTIVHSRVNSRDIGAESIDGTCKLELELPALWLAPGIYSAYFKFLVPNVASSSGRFTSDKFLIEVHGEFGHHGKAVLNPLISWKLQSHRSSQKSGDYQT